MIEPTAVQQYLKSYFAEAEVSIYWGDTRRVPRRDATSDRVMSENPYVGPRAFRVGEKLPAREREQRELTDLLIAERVVLLHSPSGAGKTSLIQAGVVPLLGEKRIGEISSFQPVPLRVKTPVPADRTVHNRYVYSVALDLLRPAATPKNSSP